MNILVPLFYVVIVGLVAIRVSLSGLPAEEKHRLQPKVYLAFAIRLALAVTMALFPKLRLFHDDAIGYELNSMAVSYWWRDLGPPVAALTGATQNAAYLYLGGALCYVLGPYQLHLSVWSGLFGTLTVVVIYRLARILFHPAVAYRAALFLAFMPSMIVWSSVAIKDPLMTLLIALSLYTYVVLRQRWSLLLVLVLAGLVASIYFFRFYVSYFVVLAILGTAIIGRAREGTSFFRNMLVLAAFAVIVVITGLSSTLTEGLEDASLERIATYRMGMATTAHSGFAEDLDVSTPAGAAIGLPIGLSVLLFGPFPWQMRSLLPLITLPEMLLWWSLAPALFRGLRFTARRSYARAAPIFVFCLSLAILYALTLGNVGAAVRQRSQIFIFLFIFVALGQYLKVCKRHHLDPMILVR